MQHPQQNVCRSQSGYGNFQQPTVYVSGHFYDNPDVQIVGGVASDVTTMQGHMIEQHDGTYILQIGSLDKDNQLPGTMLQTTSSPLDSDDKFVSNIDVKFCQQEMQFLHDNFECAESCSMPRSIIYSHYTRFCRRSTIEPMNPASFGKLIRLVFAGIKTRRLGTRGNSKYHYYGIRIKPTSSLVMMSHDDAANNSLSNEEDDSQMESDGLTLQQKEHIGFLGDASSIRLDNIGTMMLLDNDLLPEGITVDELSVFEQMYREHCQDILAHVAMMDLAALPKIWQTFWQNGQLYSDEMEDEKFITVETLHILSQAECVQKFVRQADYAFYTILLDILIPDVLRPIPGSMTLVLRNFSKNLEPWLAMSTSGIDGEMIKAKMVAANAFAQMLRRYTSLNHLAQAGRTVLQNCAHITQMLSDINRVDFTHIHEQAAWVCQCDDRLILQIEQEIKRTLNQRFTLEQWTKWLDNITHHILQNHIGTPDFAKAARQFILKWSFYSSLLLRDLTLRSATSFGSFHLIRLLFDEYMFYTIEHKVAAATGISPLAAFGDLKQFIDHTTLPPLILERSRQPSSRPLPKETATFIHFVAAGDSSNISTSDYMQQRIQDDALDGGNFFTLHHATGDEIQYDDASTEVEMQLEDGVVATVMSSDP